MSLIRIVLTLMLFPSFVVLVRGVGNRSRALRGMLLIFALGITGLIINYPNILNLTADEIGLSSGADLVLYLLVLAMITLTGYTVGKFRRSDHRVARLVHEMAVMESQSHMEPNSRKHDQK